MHFRFILLLVPILAFGNSIAQKRRQTIFLSNGGEVSEIQTVSLRKYKGNIYAGLPRLVNDSIDIVKPSTSDFVVIGHDTLISWVRKFNIDYANFDQFVRKVHSGNAINVFFTKLTDYGGFYLIKKKNEKNYRLLIDEPRLLNAIGKGYLTGNPGYIETTILRQYKGVDVLSFQTERAYIDFLIDYFFDCVLLRNKFKSEFYTSKDFLIAVREYDRCK